MRSIIPFNVLERHLAYRLQLAYQEELVFQGIFIAVTLLLLYKQIKDVLHLYYKTR